VQIESATPEQLEALEQELATQYASFQKAGLALDVTRGKPSAEQLDLSNGLDGILDGDYRDAAGTDLRNYGGVDGLPGAKALFAQVLGVQPDEMLIGGNGSLPLMYFCLQSALERGVAAPESAWRSEGRTIKFLAPVPGYDRHFTACEHLGIELVPVRMTHEGPDMDQVEGLCAADSGIKGIWCVPRFSNPTGTIYSDAVVARLAKLPARAGAHFRIFWDNAYAVHTLNDGARQVANLMDLCRKEGTQDGVYLFGSTSKITFAGAGVGFMAASPANLKVLTRHLGFSTIGPDKVNQERHVRFLQSPERLAEHMAKHAEIIRPRFELVLDKLRKGLGDRHFGSWTEPEGGYFISFDTEPGLAREVVGLAGEAGVKLTPAGATFPYGRDPEDRNIRLAPTFPTLDELDKAMDVFVVCVQLATVRKRLRA